MPIQLICMNSMLLSSLILRERAWWFYMSRFFGLYTYMGLVWVGIHPVWAAIPLVWPFIQVRMVGARFKSIDI